MPHIHDSARRWTTFILAGLTLLLIQGAASATLVIGGPGDPVSGNCYPFGCPPYWGTEYQQVYAAGDFPGQITIDGLVFYNKNYTPGTVSSGTFSISLSTTAAQVDGLDSTLANNIGADNTLVFSSSLPALSGGLLTIPFSVPFAYDPTQGNLLIDIASGNASGGIVYLDDLPGDAAGLFSRQCNGFCSTSATGFGLVTGFNTVEAVPAPPSWTLMLAGLAGLYFAAVRRRPRQPQLAAVPARSRA